MDHEFDFAKLPPLAAFSDVVDLNRYTQLPPNWSLVITDVQGSTQAIEEGRYKDVNALGAASIVAIKNAVSGHALPYVFGGDGATALVRDDWLPAVAAALRGVTLLAKNAFNLGLRIAAVPIAALLRFEAPVLVARYELAPSVSLAMLSGPGNDLAEQWVKSSEHGGAYAIDPDGPAAADFTGFECRWRPLPSRKGRVVSLLIAAFADSRDQETAIYRHVLAKLRDILGDGDGRPLSADRLSLRSAFSDFPEETRVKTGLLGPEAAQEARRKIRRATAIGQFLMAAGLKGGDFDGARYRQELVLHTDFRKFDGTLRMVLDLSAAQLEELQQFLSAEHHAARLTFGLHTSDAALITCLVDDYRANHVHFVDGSNGGYALAAKQFKAQKRRLTSRPPR